MSHNLTPSSNADRRPPSRGPTHLGTVTQVNLQGSVSSSLICLSSAREMADIQSHWTLRNVNSPGCGCSIDAPTGAFSADTIPTPEEVCTALDPLRVSTEDSRSSRPLLSHGFCMPPTERRLIQTDKDQRSDSPGWPVTPQLITGCLNALYPRTARHNLGLGTIHRASKFTAPLQFCISF